MINGDNEGLMVQENVRIPHMVRSFLHGTVSTFLHYTVSTFLHNTVSSFLHPMVKTSFYPLWQVLSQEEVSSGLLLVYW